MDTTDNSGNSYCPGSVVPGYLRGVRIEYIIGMRVSYLYMALEELLVKRSLYQETTHYGACL